MTNQKPKKLLTSLLLKLSILIILVGLFSSVTLNQNSQILSGCAQNQVCQTSGIKLTATYSCGASDKNPVTTSINLGCKGEGNPITDLLFAIIRLLSDGVGLVIVASVIVGGIQYIVSRGDPNATQLAVKRLTSAGIALLVFIFAYAILNYVVPGEFLK